MSAQETASIKSALPAVTKEDLAKPYPESVAAIITAARRELDLHGTWAKLAYALRNPPTDTKPVSALLSRWLSRTVRLDADSRPATLWRQAFPDYAPLLEPANSTRAGIETNLLKLAGSLTSSASFAASTAEMLENAWLESDRKWPLIIKQVRQLVAPRKSELSDPRTARCVGGLGIDRIANVDAVRKLMRAFQYRPVPSDPRKNIPDDVDERPFASALQGIHSRLREQRVKQHASRILEAALGLGAAPAPTAKRS